MNVIDRIKNLLTPDEQAAKDEADIAKRRGELVGVALESPIAEDRDRGERQEHERLSRALVDAERELREALGRKSDAIASQKAAASERKRAAHDREEREIVDVDVAAFESALRAGDRKRARVLWLAAKQKTRLHLGAELAFSRITLALLDAGSEHLASSPEIVSCGSGPQSLGELAAAASNAAEVGDRAWANALDALELGIEHHVRFARRDGDPAVGRARRRHAVASAMQTAEWATERAAERTRRATPSVPESVSVADHPSVASGSVGSRENPRQMGAPRSRS